MKYATLYSLQFNRTMSKLEFLKEGDGDYSIKGDLTFNTVSYKSVKLLKFSNVEKKICVSLKGIELADSAGLALIIEWIKVSKMHGTKLTFKHVPQQLLTLAELCNFDINSYLCQA